MGCALIFSNNRKMLASNRLSQQSASPSPPSPRVAPVPQCPHLLRASHLLLINTFLWLAAVSNVRLVWNPIGILVDKQERGRGEMVWICDRNVQGWREETV